MATPNICAIEDCGKPARKRGCCNMHYMRWLRHGDPLKTLTAADGEPMHFLVEVALEHDETECLIWPYSCDGSGYGNIWHEGRMRNVHRIVCEMAHGAPPTPLHEVAHNCGKGHTGCVGKSHLRWATHLENMADKKIHGTRQCRGLPNGRA